MWRIPSEHDTHHQPWLAYPWNRRIWRSDLAEAQQTITNLVHAVASFEPVNLLVPPAWEKSLSKRFRSSRVTVIPASYSDIWVRDTLPTFAIGANETLIAIDWHFNGW